MFRLQRWFAYLLAVALTSSLSATWSIILVDTRTGEIAVGSATCVAGVDLRSWTPVVLVGKGVATAQSYVDQDGRNRMLIWRELGKGTDPVQILALLAKRDAGHQTRQYGIVDASGRAVTFTGNQAMSWCGGVTGKIGSIVYAIQGNLLMGKAVVDDAVKAVRTTKGDLGQKLMAGMEAARAKGGDARCSGAKKSADVGYIILARQGDRDGGCSATGCATGDYYLALNAAGLGRNEVDPVIQLQQWYESWRAGARGRPDHHLSLVTPSSPTLPADGRRSATAVLVLRDIEGQGLTTGGAKVTVTHDPSSSAPLVIGPVRDRSNGSYSFTVTAGTKAGEGRLRVIVDDGKGPVLLTPRSKFPVIADPLWSSAGTVSVSSGGSIDFVAHPGKSKAGRAYLLLASASGSRPGVRLPRNLVLPLNPDIILDATLQAGLRGQAPFLGTLDPSGHAAVVLAIPRGAWGIPPSVELTFAFASLAPIDFVSNPVRLRFLR